MGGGTDSTVGVQEQLLESHHRTVLFRELLFKNSRELRKWEMVIPNSCLYKHTTLVMI